jgi:hypothetical protein
MSRHRSAPNADGFERPISLNSDVVNHMHVTRCRAMAPTMADAVNTSSVLQYRDARAVGQRAPYLERGGVERDVRGVPDDIALSDLDVIRLVSQSYDVSVLDEDALRPASGSRRVDDVRELRRRSVGDRLRVGLCR